MPLLDTIYYPDDTALHMWHRTETVDELLESCHRLELSLPTTATSCCEKRKAELLAEVLLLHRIFGNDVAYGHTSDGAPFVNVDGCHISVSHSGNWVCIARNNRHRIGLDVEQCSRRVLRVRERFLNASELTAIKSDDVVANTLAWTAKEALYKLFLGSGGASLSDHYSIGDCTQIINRGYIIRPAEATCLPGEPLTIISQEMSDAVISLAVETKYLNTHNK